MPKITFMGAGSTVFAKNVLGDCMQTPSLQDSHIALYDIDPQRLEDCRLVMENLNANTNGGRAKITAHLGTRQRRAALQGANYVVNAIQVGGYKPSTVIDFEIPKKYGLRQTIADTLGIGGIFRALRTIPIVLDFAHDMAAICPDAWFRSYVNPMAMVTAGLLRGSSIRAVGLCHSVQGCGNHLAWMMGMKPKKLKWTFGGINHQTWILSMTDEGRDIYPEVRRRAAEAVARIRKAGPKKVIAKVWGKLQSEGKGWWTQGDHLIAHDLVRLELMRNFGHYVTESSEHSSEYMPWFIKATHPELIEEFNIPLDEYPRRCISQIAGWKKQREALINDAKLAHKRTHEYGSYIMDAIETDVPFRIGGNVMNTGLVTNLPAKACVEIPCLVDRNGVQGCYVGDLPEQCAAINRTNINPQVLTVEAVLTGKKDLVYQAAMLDPHTAAELTLDEIRDMCDDLIKAHGKMLPKLK